MIKKYKVYKESLRDSKRTLSGLSLDDIEDHFLRLIEIFGCEFEITSTDSINNEEFSRINYVFRKKFDSRYSLMNMEVEDFVNIIKKIHEEYDNIKHRIEFICPNIQIVNTLGDQTIGDMINCYTYARYFSLKIRK